MREEGHPGPRADDGLLIREGGPWIREKLEIERRYMHGFNVAASRKAPTTYVVDAFAATGLNRIRGTNEIVAGSTLLALETDPPFERCLSVELGHAEAEVLRTRTARFGDRSIVVEGDCNNVLLPAMHRHINRRAPVLAIFDPQGPHLDWNTVAALSRFREGKTKVEQLILVPTYIALMRELPVKSELAIEDWAERDFRRVFGNDEWRFIHEQRKLGHISGDSYAGELVNLYERGLKSLGYRTVLDRDIRVRGEAGRPLYSLLFATDHPAGESIMDQVFDAVFPEHEQQKLFTPGRRKRLTGQ